MGEGRETLLEPKASALLAYLVAHQGRDISRDELMHEVWGGHIVSDGAINRVIVRLRRALGDEQKARRYIVTVPKVGYRFVADAAEHALPPAPEPAPAPQPRPASHGRMIWAVAAFALVVAASVTLMMRREPPSVQQPPTLSPLVRLSSLQFDAAVAPDGRQVVYSERHDGGIDIHWLADETSNPHRIGAQGGRATGARWSPDGDRLVYVFRGKDGCAFHLLDMTAPTFAEPQEVAPCTSVMGIPVVFSADGATLFFGEKAHPYAPFILFALDLTTGETRRLPQPDAKGRGHYWLDVHPETGKMLVLSAHAPGETTAYSLDPVGGTYEEVARWPYKVDTAVWSHKGDAVVHQGRHPSYQLVETALAGGETKVLVSDSRRMMHPQRIAGGRDYSFTSYLYNRDLMLDGMPLETLNSSVMDYLPTLSRSGRKLAFISKRSGESRLYVQDFDSGRLASAELQQKGRALFGIDWSFDDRQLLLTTSNELLVFDLTSERIVHTHTPESPAFGATWSGHGSFTYSSYEGNRWQLYDYRLQGSNRVAREPRWAFALTSPEAELLVDQDMRILAGGRQIDVTCAWPMYSYSLTYRLDRRTFYCISPDDPEALVRVTDLMQTDILSRRLNRTTRHYSVTGNHIAQAKLQDAASDILRTRFPEK